MNLKALAAGSAAALTLTGSAMAATHTVPSHIQVLGKKHITVKVQRHKAGNAVVTGGLLGAAVTYLGVDRATLVADLKAGQSLAQVATAKGLTADGLVAALLAPAKLKLDVAVAAGRLTSARATTIVTHLTTVLTTVVNKTVTPRTKPTTRTHVRVNPGSIFQAATSYLGVDLKTILQDVRGGKTLADIAVAQNKTAAGLVDAIVASAKTQLDKQVTAGHLTAQQESDFLAQFQTSVTTLVNGS